MGEQVEDLCLELRAVVEAELALLTEDPVEEPDGGVRDVRVALEEEPHEGDVLVDEGEEERLEGEVRVGVVLQQAALHEARDLRVGVQVAALLQQLLGNGVLVLLHGRLERSQATVIQLGVKKK